MLIAWVRFPSPALLLKAGFSGAAAAAYQRITDELHRLDRPGGRRRATSGEQGTIRPLRGSFSRPRGSSRSWRSSTADTPASTRRQDRSWFLLHVLDRYTALGLDDQRRVIEERILPVAYSAREERIRGQDRIDFGRRPLKKSRLDELNDLIGEHDDARVALIRANPGLFVG